MLPALRLFVVGVTLALVGSIGPVFSGEGIGWPSTDCSMCDAP